MLRGALLHLCIDIAAGPGFAQDSFIERSQTSGSMAALAKLQRDVRVGSKAAGFDYRWECLLCS